FPLKGLTRGSVLLRKGVHHAQAYDDDYGTCQSMCLRRVFAATLFFCPIAGARAEPAKNRPLSSYRQTARRLGRAPLWGQDHCPEYCHNPYRSCRATGLGANRLCRAGDECTPPTGVYSEERCAACTGVLVLSQALWS